MHVRTHSYSSEIAGVVEMRLVMGGSSLRTNLGSSGVKVANCVPTGHECLSVLQKMITYKLDDLNQHPIIGTGCEYLEQLWDQWQVIRWIRFPR